MRTQKTIYRHMEDYSVTGLRFLEEHAQAMGPLGLAAKVALECMAGEEFKIERVAELMGSTPEEAQAGVDALMACGLLRRTDDDAMEVGA